MRNKTISLTWTMCGHKIDKLNIHIYINKLVEIERPEQGTIIPELEVRFPRCEENYIVHEHGSNKCRESGAKLLRTGSRETT